MEAQIQRNYTLAKDSASELLRKLQEDGCVNEALEHLRALLQKGDFKTCLSHAKKISFSSAPTANVKIVQALLDAWERYNEYLSVCRSKAARRIVALEGNNSQDLALLGEYQVARTELELLAAKARLNYLHLRLVRASYQ